MVLKSVISGLVISQFFFSFAQCQTSSYLYRTKYFDTKLDHFSFTTNATFKLRYLVNDTYWTAKSNAPIFFYTGNEGDITLFAQNTGFMWDIAPEFNALLIFAEHRYYGQSLPFGSKSKDPAHLGFLSSSQALMDYVELISILRENTSNHPVIVFGGSYGGMLAAWMRMKYPATVAGAIAASAPIWQFTGMTPCDAFNRVLTSAFTAESSACSDNIRASWKAIENITSTDKGKSWLSKTWKLCEPLKTSENIVSLKSTLNDVYGNLAMVNYPYPSEFLAPLPGHPVKVFCSHLSEKHTNETEILTALFEGLNVYFNYTGKTSCLNYSSAYNLSLDDSLWQYQSCTEMVMPMCSTGKHDMFAPEEWNITEYAKGCYKSFKAIPQVNLVNNLYGGKQISSVSNIIFSNGLLDPWSSGGVMRSVSKSVIAVVIPEGAHHLDLRASDPLDPESVVRARQYYRQVISHWIQGHKSSEPTINVT